MNLCYHCMTRIEEKKKGTCPHCGKRLDTPRKSDRFLQPGTRLQGKFIVGHPIGYGGFGNTYIGWNELLLRKVAIKEYYPEQFCHRDQDGVTITASSSGKPQVRFQRGLHSFLEEARKVAALQDIKGVVKIANFFEDNGTGYIIMEYLEGMDVKTILKTSGNKKDYEWSRRVTLTVLHTLKQVHARGVLHRDIAPDNIFVTNEGVIKLIDFGAAKSTDELGGNGEIILKKGYSPIEQYGNNIPQGPYTDLYGVAAMFYYMITGQRPLPANERIVNDGLIAPSDMGIQIPQQAEFAIMICLNIKPEYRLQSADEFMEALGGSRFIPVYEPEWILPKVKDNSTTANKLKSLPLSAKIAMGVFVVLLLAGGGFGGYAYKQSKSSVTAEVSSAILPSFSGKTMEQAKELVQSLNDTYGMNIELKEGSYIYTTSEEDNGIIKEQSISPGIDLQDVTVINNLENSTLIVENGYASGTIYCDIYSNEFISYKSLQEKNAFEISQMLEKDIKKDPMFVKAKGKDGEVTKYWDLKEITLDSGDTIKKASLVSEDNSKETIEVAKIKSISYYASDFFYWVKLPDFAQKYGSKKELKKASFQMYNYTDENNRGEAAKKQLSSSMYDEDYYSLDSEYQKGKIIGQTVDPGTEYDGSKSTDLKIKMIGSYISLSDMSANQAESTIKDATKKCKNVKIEVSNGDNSLAGYTVTNEDGKEVKYFKDNVTIKLRGEEPKPTPKKKKKKSSGSSKKKNSGGSKKNSGGGMGVF